MPRRRSPAVMRAKTDHGVFAADNSLQGWFVIGNALAHGADQADAPSRIAHRRRRP